MTTQQVARLIDTTTVSPGVQRQALAELIRETYRTTGESRTTAAAEDGLAMYDAMFGVLCRLVGGNGHEGDLFDPKAHADARKIIGIIAG